MITEDKTAELLKRRWNNNFVGGVLYLFIFISEFQRKTRAAVNQLKNIK